jgi:hypothetical protein
MTEASQDGNREQSNLEGNNNKAAFFKDKRIIECNITTTKSSRDSRVRGKTYFYKQ